MAGKRFGERPRGAGCARKTRAWSRPWVMVAALIRMRGLRADRPRRIDLVIDYFGERRQVGQHG
jgi:hypothetical protein